MKNNCKNVADCLFERGVAHVGFIANAETFEFRNHRGGQCSRDGYRVHALALLVDFLESDF